MELKLSKAPGVYMIMSKTTKQRYVGASQNIEARRLTHLSRLDHGKHGNINLQSHIDNYGIDDLDFNVLEYCDKSKLSEREQYYIDFFLPEFNIRNTDGTFYKKSKLSSIEAYKCKLLIEESKQGRGNFVLDFYEMSLAEIENEVIDTLVKYFNGNISKVAKQLNLTRQTVYNKLKSR